MASGSPKVYSIAAHRGFADALAAGLLPRYRDPDVGLARLTLLLPSSRAIRTMTDAFVRISGEGLLLPRMAVVGDLDLDETLGPLLDPLGSEADIPPAVDPTYRWLKLAAIIGEEDGADAPEGAALMRLSTRMAQVMDRLLIEDIAPDDLVSDRTVEIVGNLAEHWEASTRRFARVQARWLAHLQEIGRVDAATRRNRLFDHAARRWRANPPAGPIVAAGVTSAAPALANLLRAISELEYGSVILPDFDLTLDEGVWAELGRAGVGENREDEPFAANDAVTHPQYHLKLLLNRMGVNRAEVQPWHRAGIAKAPPERSHAVSAVFLPPEASRRWVDLPSAKRRMTGIRIMQAAHPEEEAQAIALLVREALAEPEKRVAVVTPDRSLARRVSAHLERWNIRADDSAGQPLSLTAAGRALLLLAEIAASHAAPVDVLAVLGHPLVANGDPAWLENVRKLDRALRGPRLAPGLAAYHKAFDDKVQRDGTFMAWWRDVEPIIASLTGQPEDAGLSEVLGCLIESAERLGEDRFWSREDGRALARFIDDLRQPAAQLETRVRLADLPIILRDAMEQVAVRPPYGGHPRVAIYGLLEARMTRAELVICAGLNEGSWPASPALDPVLPPPVLRALGVPGADFRIGLAAHDLAGLLGAPEVVLSRSARDASGPAIPSRFLLRIEALLGERLMETHSEKAAIAMAQAIDYAEAQGPYPVPRPRPSAEQRRVPLSVTAIDRLRSDPYQFYASSILNLRALDSLDAEPSAALQGTLAHAILERWHNDKGDLQAIAEDELRQMGAHAVVRALWGPRLTAALEWVAETIAADTDRTPAVIEGKGKWLHRGVEINGRADRIDRLPDGSLAIVDYKTGKPPGNAQVKEGFALQLGTLGLIARHAPFVQTDEEGQEIARISGEAQVFEYWSLGRSDASETGFGYVTTPVKVTSRHQGIEPERFLPTIEAYLNDALDRWILGNEPFTATVQPDLPRYGDYDQLMRLAEWLGRESGDPR